MPPRDWKLRVEDMIEAIEPIQKYTDQLSYEEFASDSKTVDAVVRRPLIHHFKTLATNAKRNSSFISSFGFLSVLRPQLIYNKATDLIFMKNKGTIWECTVGCSI